MNAQASVSSPMEHVHSGLSLRALAYSLLAAATGSLLLVAAVLALGSSIGRTHQPLSNTTLLALGATMILVVGGLRLGWAYLGVIPRRSQRLGIAWWGLCGAILVLFGIALSRPPVPVLAARLCWTMLIAAEGTTWLLGWFGPGTARILPRMLDAVRSRRRRDAARNLLPRPAGQDADAESDTAESAETTATDLLPDEVVQQLTRVVKPDGTDVVSGLLQAHFAPSQRSQSLHVAFCPPMPHRPDVSVVQLSGPKSQVKAGEVQPYGIRFDIRLVRAADQPQHVIVHFEARGARPSEN